MSRRAPLLFQRLVRDNVTMDGVNSDETAFVEFKDTLDTLQETTFPAMSQP